MYQQCCIIILAKWVQFLIWFLSILKQGKNLNEGPVDDSSTIAGAYNVSIGDYVILSFSFSKDQNITFFKKQNKDTL